MAATSSDRQKLMEQYSNVWKDGQNKDEKSGIELNLVNHLKQQREAPQWRTAKTAMNQIFREFLSQSSGAVRVMDAGCGLGLDLCEMAQVAEESGKEVSIVGIDFNSSMLQYAANRVRELTLSDRVNCSIERGDLADLSTLEDNSFDFIREDITLQHLHGDVQVKGLNELRRVLKPGGRMYMLEGGISDFLTPDDVLKKVYDKLVPRSPLGGPALQLYFKLPTLGFKNVDIEKSFAMVYTGKDLLATDPDGVKAKGMGVMAMRNKLVETEEEANDFVSRYNKAKEENNVVGGGVNMIIVATK